MEFYKSNYLGFAVKLWVFLAAVVLQKYLLYSGLGIGGNTTVESYSSGTPILCLFLGLWYCSGILQQWYYRIPY